MADKKINSNLEVQGDIKVTTVPNSTGTVVTYDPNTKLLGTRTDAQILTDLGVTQALDTKEPKFDKNTGFNKNFGSTVGTVVEGNDPRLLAAQTALDHNLQTITNNGNETTLPIQAKYYKTIQNVSNFSFLGQSSGNKFVIESSVMNTGTGMLLWNISVNTRLGTLTAGNVIIHQYFKTTKPAQASDLLESSEIINVAKTYHNAEGKLCLYIETISATTVTLNVNVFSSGAVEILSLTNVQAEPTLMSNVVTFTKRTIADKGWAVDNMVDRFTNQSVGGVKTWTNLRKQELFVGIGNSHLSRYSDIKSLVTNAPDILSNIRIDLPINGSTMWTLKVEIIQYDSNTSTSAGVSIKPAEVILTGYGNTNVNRSVLCNNPDILASVSWGRNTTNTKSVLILKSFNGRFHQPKIVLSEFTTYYFDNPLVYINPDNYNISLVTTEDDFTLTGIILNKDFIRDSYVKQTQTSFTHRGQSVNTNASNINSVTTSDSRNRNYMPSTDLRSGVWFDWKTSSELGVPSHYAWISSIMTFVPSTSDTINNGSAYRLIFTGGRFYFQAFLGSNQWGPMIRLTDSSQVSQTNIDSWNNLVNSQGDYLKRDQKWVDSIQVDGFRSIYRLLSFSDASNSLVNKFLQIHTPISNNTQWRMKLIIKEYSSIINAKESFTEINIISYGNGIKSIQCSNPDRLLEVRLGLDATSKITLIVIPSSSWSQPKVVIEQIDYNYYSTTSVNYQDPSKFLIEFNSDLTGYTSFSSILNKDFTRDSFYLNASNLNAGTVSIDRLPTGTTSSTVALGNHDHGAKDILLSKPNNIDYNVPLSNLVDNTLVFSSRFPAYALNGFPVVNNANSALTVSTHPGYSHQIGFSSNGSLYHRHKQGGLIHAWTKLLTSTDITQTDIDSWNSIVTNQSNYIPLSQKGVALGVATLDENGTVTADQLPSYVDDVIEVDSFALLPLIGEKGKIYVTIDNNKTYRWSGTGYVYITSGAVDSVNGMTGIVVLNKSHVGLSLVDNTSDVTKNVFSATKLTTPRNINNVPFDGTQDIIILDDTKEPAFEKNTGFNKNFGSTVGTVVEGNDLRLYNQRVPLPHVHTIAEISLLQDILDDIRDYVNLDVTDLNLALVGGNFRTKNNSTNIPTGWSNAITYGLIVIARRGHNFVTQILISPTKGVATRNKLGLTFTDWVVNSASDHVHDSTEITGLQILLDGKEDAFGKNTAFNKNFGSTAGTVTQGNDPRLSDSRNPLSHVHSADDITSGILSYDRLPFSFTNLVDWNTAFGWGNHATVGYSTQTLFAGTNILISGNIISSVDTTYAASTLLLLQAGTDVINRVHSVKLLNDWINSKNYLTAIDINSKADKAITITGSGGLVGGGDLSVSRSLDLSTLTKSDIAEGVISHGWGNHSLVGYSMQTLTPGNNISIVGNVISSENTNTLYSAGMGLSLSGTTFSLPVTILGTGDFISSVTQDTNGITVTKSTLPVASLVTSNTITGVTNSATSNTNTYLNIVRDGVSPGSSTQITGSGGTSVSSDVNGKLTINSSSYGSMSSFELNEGTAIVSRVINAKTLTDWIISKGYSTQTLIAGTNITISGNTISSIDTTYYTGSLADITTGTNTTIRVWSPKTLSDWIESKSFLTATDISNKADKTISIIAGTGLTGGGTLAANRTLNVTYGTTLGTAVEGNDLRVVESFNKKINAITITGDVNKTLTLTREDGTTLLASFSDLNTESPDDVINTMSFNSLTGVLSAVTSLGSTITSSLDGRYSLLAHSHSMNDITGLTAALSGKANSSHVHSATEITSGILSYDRLPISSANVANWNTAFGWGNHALAGYLTSGTLPSGSLITSSTASGISNTATSNTTTFLNFVQGGSSVGSSTQITGSGATSVSSDVNGKLTIHSAAYSLTSLVELTAGTVTSARYISAKLLSDWIDSKGFSTQTLTAGTNVSISGNVISATDTTYYTGSLADITTGTNTTIRVWSPKTLSDWIDSKGFSTQTLIAGTNITISGNTISSVNVNTTYSAGAGLTLSGTVFSLPVTYSGSGDFISNVVQSANGISVTRSSLPVSSLVTSSTNTGITNIATSNTNTFLNFVQGGSSVGSSTQITGAGPVTVSSDVNGKVTISALAYSTIPIAELILGTSTSARYVSAKVLTEWIDSKGFSTQTLTEGSNISISGGIISATDTTYYSGSVADLTQGTNGTHRVWSASILSSWIDSKGFSTQTLIAGSNITITGNTISAVNTTYGSMSLAELSLGTVTSSRVISAKTLRDWIDSKGFSTQTLTAGSNISISGNTISAVNTVYGIGTVALVNAGLSDTALVWSPQRLSEWLAGKNFLTSTDISNKADKSIVLYAGTGLTGGGDLSANRTFNVTYGTSAGTSAQGNDSRINNGQSAFGWGNHATVGYSTQTLVAGTNITITGNTISAVNTNSTYSAGTGLTLSGSVFSLPVAQVGAGDFVSSVVQTANGITVTRAAVPIASLITATTSTGVTNIATSNTNTFLNIVRDGVSPGSSTQVTGTGAVTVSSDSNGKLSINVSSYSTISLAELVAGTVTSARYISSKNINDWIDGKGFSTQNLVAGANINISGNTISATNTNTTYSAGSGLTLSGTVFSLPITYVGSGPNIADVVQNTNGITVTRGFLPRHTLVLTNTTTGTSNAVTGNTNTYLNMLQDNVVQTHTQITGTGGTTVTSDGLGKLTINSVNTQYGMMSLAEMVAGTSGSVRVVAASIMAAWLTEKTANFITSGYSTIPVASIGSLLLTNKITSVFARHASGLTLTIPNATSYPGYEITLCSLTAGSITMNSYQSSVAQFLYKNVYSDQRSLIYSVRLISNGSLWVIVAMESYDTSAVRT